MSKESYLQAVSEGLRAVKNVDVDFVDKLDAEAGGNFNPANGIYSGAERKKIYVRLLLSIHRRESTEAAMETVKLALQMKHLGVVGIDLSGNPVIGEWETFLPALKFAKEQGLSVNLHSGEVPNAKQVHAMLDFLPGRIGHACYYEEEHWRKLKSSRIPVCISFFKSILLFFNTIYGFCPCTLSKKISVCEGDLVAIDKGFNFELDELLRASGLGIVYKVVLGNGVPVAVRRLGEGGEQRYKEFVAEIRAIGRVKHPNVVRLSAYYGAPDEKFLISDFISNGSLASALHGSWVGLIWNFEPKGKKKREAEENIRINVVRRLKSIASGRSSVSEPILA